MALNGRRAAGAGRRRGAGADAAGRVLILASASPRRRQLLRAAGIALRTHPADVAEVRRRGETPRALVRRLAQAKAAAVSGAHPGRVVLAADTVVALGSRVFGKPRDRAHAGRMIRALSGRTHHVYTGVCLRQDRRDVVWVCRTAVTFRKLTAAAIQAYLAVARPLDKAGAYAIQEHGDRLVARYVGSFSNVVGLPVEEVVARLRAFGLRPRRGRVSRRSC